MHLVHMINVKNKIKIENRSMINDAQILSQSEIADRCQQCREQRHHLKI